MLDIFYLDEEALKIKKKLTSNGKNTFGSDVKELSPTPLHRAQAEELENIKEKPLWIDVTNITKAEGELLQRIFGLHAVTVDDLFTVRSRIKVEEFPNYLFCVFYTVYRGKKIGFQDLDFVIGPNYIITNHRREVPRFESIKQTPVVIAALLKRGKEYLLHRLLSISLDNYHPLLEYFDLKIERLEEKATKADKGVIEELLKLKRTILFVKRMMHTQREKLSFLAKNDYPLISKKSLPYFRDLYDQAIWIADKVDNFRDAITSVFDAYTSTVSQSMTEIMKVLSIFAAIALPLTVISGIYGTNFTVLPGAGARYGFWLMIGSMLTVVVGMLLVFRKRKWI